MEYSVVFKSLNDIVNNTKENLFLEGMRWQGKKGKVDKTWIRTMGTR